MSYFTGLRCALCHSAFPAEALYVCDKCLGPLEATYDMAALRRDVSRELIESRPENLWRYREFLPVLGDPLTGFHSGYTPLVRADRLAKELGVETLYLKDDSNNHPTLSYKDRVVSVAATRAVELGIGIFGCASTGNLGNSVAAHAARLGLECYVFIPRTLEPGKILGSAVSGPHVVAVDGNYDDVNRLCTQLGDRYSWGFANINLRSYYAEGAKTYAFEIAEQLGWVFPRHVVSPVAGGTLLPRIARGFRELRETGLVEGDLPTIHAAQAAGCAPVINALEEGIEYPEPGQAQHDCQVHRDRQPGRRVPGRQVGHRVGWVRGNGDRRGDSRRHPAPGDDRGHLHRAGRRHDARRHDQAPREGRDPPRRVARRLHHGERVQDGRRHGRPAGVPDPAGAEPQGLRGVLREPTRGSSGRIAGWARSRKPPRSSRPKATSSTRSC